MSVTLASVESTLVLRCGPRLTLVGLDIVTLAGRTATLADPIASSLRSLGVDLANPLAPTDADFATIADPQVSQLLDIAELRCLETVLGNLTMTNEQVGVDKQDWAKYAENLQAAIETLRTLYGIGVTAPTIGTIGLNFAESGDPLDWQEQG